MAAFGLEDAPMIVSDADLAAFIQHVAEVLGKPIGHGDDRLEGLKDDFKAFAKFQADPTMRSSGAHVGFLTGLRAGKAI